MARPQRSRTLGGRKPSRALRATGAVTPLAPQNLDGPSAVITGGRLPAEVSRQAQREMDRLRRLPAGSPEAGQVRAYLQWLDTQFTRWAAEGWEMNEVLRGPVPEAYRRWAAWPAEYTRNVAHLYPRYERAALSAPKAP